MCVIVVKPAGADCPTLETLEACWNSNPDGAGIAMSERGSVFWRKGFMNFDDFSAYFKAESVPKRSNQALAFHFRIGTHGLKDGGNTHPFPLAGDPFVLRQLAGRAPVAVAHNGVFKNTVTLPKVSDTGQFVADCCAAHSGGGVPDIVGYWKSHKDVVSWSRLAVLYPKNRYVLLGTWHCEDDCGCFFSNNSWKYKAAKYTGFGADWDGEYVSGAGFARGSYGEPAGDGKKNWLGGTLLAGGGPLATLAAAKKAMAGGACSKTQRIPVPGAGGGPDGTVKVWVCGKKEVEPPDGSKGPAPAEGEAAK